MSTNRSDRDVLYMQTVVIFLVWTFAAVTATGDPGKGTYLIPLTVTGELPRPKTPMDPVIDFTALIKRAGLKGVLNPNSIQVVDVETGGIVSHALSQHFGHGDKGRVQWVIEDPAHKEYEIRFRIAAKRLPLVPKEFVPLVGTGDPIRYNAGCPRPFGLPNLSRLVDLTGDGLPDLVGCPVYTYLPRWPEERIPAGWGGIFCWRRVGRADEFEFGDPARLGYLQQPGAGELTYFAAGYMHADVADLNGDGLFDIVFTAPAKSSGPSRIKDVHKYAHLYLNSGKRDAGGMPVFVTGPRVALPVETSPPSPAADRRKPDSATWTSTVYWGPVRAVDLNGDGAIDFVFGSMYRDEAVRPDTSAYYIRNTNPAGWPIRPAKPVKIDLGKRACFYDVDGDGLLDSVCLVHDQEAKRLKYEDRVAWRRNVGGDPPRFGSAELLDDVDVRGCYFTAAVCQGPRRGILVAYSGFQRVAFFERKPGAVGKPRFSHHLALSISAAINMGDQATPCPCDWDGDGDWDLLVGGGFGRVRILINEGTNQRPVFAESQPILSEGKPIRVFMSQVFPGLEEYHHNMGYPHPAYIDWDADGLPDLMLPNITNRIFWYKNIGTRRQPKFGPRHQVICDGFPDTPQTRQATARLLGAGTKQWRKRVPDPNSPFFWRSRAGFGDLDGDGLVDMITADGRRPGQSILFVQYRDAQGNLRLRKKGVIRLTDGTVMQNVGGQPAQTIPVDWDGDGLLDLIINHGRTFDSAPALVQNVGTKTEPKFAPPVRLACFGDTLVGLAKHGPYYGVGDLDGDGRPDLLACPEMGTYLFFRHTALEMVERPALVLGKVRVMVQQRSR